MFGKDDNADLPNDPLNWPQTKRLAESHPLNEFDFGTLEPFEPSISIRAKVQVGRQSDLVRVAFEPTLRIKEVK